MTRCPIPSNLTSCSVEDTPSLAERVPYFCNSPCAKYLRNINNFAQLVSSGRSFFDESDVDDNILCETEEDEDDCGVNQQGLGTYQNQILGTESEDDQANESSDDDLPLINLLPSGKKRKWKRTTFHPQIERYQPTVQIPLPPDSISEPIHYFVRYLDDKFFESMALYTNMKEVKKTGKSLETGACELKKFFACCMLIVPRRAGSNTEKTVQRQEFQEKIAASGVPRKDILDYLGFKFSLAKSLLYSKKVITINQDSDVSEEEECDETSVKRRKILPVPDKRLRKQDAKHLPEIMSEKQKSRSKCRYQGCKGLTFTKCTGCNMFLCCSMNKNQDQNADIKGAKD
ncbi:Transposase IS4 [Popillia japonica]|uniref:Transposase IS4 n=1 Tax=Popillia japonica TaxID=7064 RepID=A0AAW1J160_POPJA